KWWAQDFSWAGLAVLNEKGDPKHPWQGWSITPDGRVMEREDPALPEGSRDATLQDYWRWDGTSLRSDDALLEAGLLEDHDGQPRFHICHLPEHWKDGSKSWKSEANCDRWDTLNAELEVRINAASRTEAKRTENWEHDQLIGPDRRTQLTGGQIRKLPFPQLPARSSTNRTPPHSHQRSKTQSTYHLKADHALWLTDANFTDAIFASPADFNHTQFLGGNANFINAQFTGGKTNFYKAKFSGGSANFYNVRFSGGHADFYNVQFSGGYADFYNARFFGGDADFQSTSFHYTARFGGSAEQRGATEFSAPGFHHQVSFRKAEFQDTIEFRDCYFSDSPGNTQSAFAGARFREVVDLNSATRLPLDAFNGAVLEKPILLHADAPRRSGFDDTRTAIRAHIDGLSENARNTQANDLWAALEGGCRTLKRAMAQQGDHHREQQFFRMELMARQNRPVRSDAYRDGQLTRWDRWAARAYGVFADYGASFLRPLGWVMGGAFGLALVYFCLGNGARLSSMPAFGFDYGGLALIGHILSTGASESVDLAFQQVFRPFFIWAPGYAETGEGWIQTVKATSHPAWWLVIKILATLQSFISIALLFLSGLALRRKFQIG
ncbi:pentapeptide repeat-containing protein, partial [Maricaulis sp. D1M11]|uniref:pentapeptide repeat-containing protein n=1 Tax=Maricaulis sp. D1M11 TaxID=3076117 RepID=UPI0039B6B01E